MREGISRRNLLVAGAAALTPTVGVAQGRRPLRVAHMTDFHIQPEMKAAVSCGQAFRHAARQKPDLVLAGGDLIMDAVSQSESRTRLLWELFAQAARDNIAAPIRPALGNHDVWGTNRALSRATGSEPAYGKGWFLDFFGLARPFYSFDQGSWHFVVLDNVHLTPTSYLGQVSNEQLDWLREDLSRTKRPTLVMTHIPLLSVTSMLRTFDQGEGRWRISSRMMTRNVEAVQAVFASFPHVKIAVSGHTHLTDRVDYDGVTYLCGGAVSGAWWKGNNLGCRPGYRLLDLQEDGSFSHRYVAWGWKDPAASE